jgi:hypothetical protein
MSDVEESGETSIPNLIILNNENCQKQPGNQFKKESLSSIQHEEEPFTASASKLKFSHKREDSDEMELKSLLKQT